MNTARPTSPDFSDMLDDLIEGPARDTPHSSLPVAFTPALERPEYVEGCPACRGTGLFHGRRGYPCFKCNGRGKRTFKTPPAERAAGRARAAAKRIEREADKAQWREEHKAELAWLERAKASNDRRGGDFDFPAKLLEAVAQYGALTENQTAAVQKLMARDAARDAERNAKHSVPVDARRIEAAFERARERAARPGALGIWTKPLKPRAQAIDLTFHAASPDSKWAGQIFVRNGEKKLGWIQAGMFVRRLACTDVEARAVAAACDAPAEAATAYGKAWGICSCCGQTLTNDESIARGIGPICAENYGW